MKTNRLLKAVLLLVVWISATTICAQSVYNVKITALSHEPVFISLDKTPKVTVEKSDLVVSTTSLTLLYPMSDCARFEFADPSEVKSIQDECLRLTVDDNMISLSGLGGEHPVSIWDIEGHFITGGSSSAEGLWSTSTSLWESGIYIIKSESFTTKFIIR